MKGKILLGAIAAGAVVGSVAAISMIPCYTDSRTRRKMMKYKNHMFKTVGSVLDAMAEFKR